MKKIKFGILSTANIGIQALLPAFKQSNLCELKAISSRNLNKAKSVAKRNQIETYYGNYDELLMDNSLDAVYIPLPNHLHIDWAIKAIKAGKHVLCEKPISVDTKDGERILSVLNSNPNIVFMEAFMYRFHKQWRKVRELINAGKIGDIIDIKVTFSYDNPDPENIRNKYKNGGGGLLDVGCYCINLSRMIYDDEPLNVFGSVVFDPKFEIDVYAKGLLEFPKGHASFAVGTKTVNHQEAVIVGSKGMLTIENPFYASPLESTVNINLKTDKRSDDYKIKPENQYATMVDHFASCVIEKKSPIISIKNSINNMKVIDGIFKSNTEKSWVKL